MTLFNRILRPFARETMYILTSYLDNTYRYLNVLIAVEEKIIIRNLSFLQYNTSKMDFFEQNNALKQSDS